MLYKETLKCTEKAGLSQSFQTLFGMFFTFRSATAEILWCKSLCTSDLWRRQKEMKAEQWSIRQSILMGTLVVKDITVCFPGLNY